MRGVIGVFCGFIGDIRLHLIFAKLRGQALGVLALLWVGALPALAETRPLSPDLYLEAMQALSEGRLEDARATVAHMSAQQPQNAGAWLDLAILQCSLGNAAGAELLLADIERRFSPPPGILEVIALQRAQGCPLPKPPVRHYARLSAGRGVDSNANQGASSLNFNVGSGAQALDLVLLPQYAPRGDQFTWVEAEFGKAFGAGGTSNSNSGFVQLQARKNDVESGHDLTSLNLGLEHMWQTGPWAWRGTASGGWVQLGGALYQQQGQLQLLASRAFVSPQTTNLSLVADWTRVNYPTLAQFDAQMWQGRSVLTHVAGDVRLKAGVGYAYDQQLNQRPGGDRMGWGADVSAEMPLGRQVSGGVNWSRQNWRGQSPYSPGLIDSVRQQRLDVLRASLTFPLKAGQAIKLELRQVRNDENISIFQYESRVLQLSWEWQLGS